ncbi:MAG: hypothetical protein ACJA1C_003437 [Crocinitomicaceae bacterium]|jgi:hypothetical protein
MGLRQSKKKTSSQQSSASKPQILTKSQLIMPKGKQETNVAKSKTSEKKTDSKLGTWPPRHTINVPSSSFSFFNLVSNSTGKVVKRFSSSGSSNSVGDVKLPASGYYKINVVTQRGVFTKHFMVGSNVITLDVIVGGKGQVNPGDTLHEIRAELTKPDADMEYVGKMIRFLPNAEKNIIRDHSTWFYDRLKARLTDKEFRAFLELTGSTDATNKNKQLYSQVGTEAAGGEYTVVKGDGSRAIASKVYGTEILASIVDNYVKTKTIKGKLSPGQKLELPKINVAKEIKHYTDVNASTEFTEGSEMNRYRWYPYGIEGSKGSGVTLGYGYDMGNRNFAQVKAHLEKAKFPAAYITLLKTSVGLTGSAAVTWAKNNKDKFKAYESNAAVKKGMTALLRKVLYTPEMNEALANISAFEIKYQVTELGKSADEATETGIPFKALHPTIIEILTDLHYNGLGRYSIWKVIREGVIKNDLAIFTEKMADPAILSGGNYKRFNRKLTHLMKSMVIEIDSLVRFSNIKLTEDQKKTMASARKLINNKEENVKKGKTYQAQIPGISKKLKIIYSSLSSKTFK